MKSASCDVGTEPCKFSDQDFLGSDVVGSQKLLPYIVLLECLQIRGSFDGFSVVEPWGIKLQKSAIEIFISLRLMLQRAGSVARCNSEISTARPIMSGTRNGGAIIALFRRTILLFPPGNIFSVYGTGAELLERPWYKSSRWILLVHSESVTCTYRVSLWLVHVF